MPDVFDSPVPVRPTFPRLCTPPADGGSSAVAALNQVAKPIALHEPPAPVDGIATNAVFDPHYLVILTGLCEDLPVAMFDIAEEAVAFSREVRANPDAHAERYFEATERPGSARRCSWVSVSVIEFSGPIPMTRTVLFDLD